jgi:hypothetical protein
MEMSDERAIVEAERAADAQLSDEMDALEREPDPQEVAVQRLKARLVALAARLDFNANALVHEDPRQQRRLVLPAHGTLAGRHMSPEECALALLAKRDLDGLLAWGSTELERFYASLPVGTPAEARARRRATIAQVRAAVRCREEAAIRRAAAHGEMIERRPEVAPAYALAPDEDLAREGEPSRIDVERYWDLRGRAVACYGTLREAGNRRHLAHLEHERAAAHLRAAEEAATSNGTEVPEELRALAGERREALEHAERVYVALHAEWESAARLAIACREHAEAQQIEVA